MINILNTQYDSEYDDQCMDCPELNTEKTMAEVNHQCAVYVTCQRYHERFVSRRWRLMKLAVAVGICVWFLTITFLYYKHYDKSTKGVSMSDQAYCDALDRFRCENGGLLMNTGRNFVCKCAPLFYGERCSHRFLGTPPGGDVSADLRRGTPNFWWSVLPFTSQYQQKIAIYFYQDHLERIKNRLSSVDSENYPDGTSVLRNSRILPPARPLHCKADKSFPTTDLLYKRIFQRKPGGFIQDTKRRNILYYSFYQFFVLQFFNNADVNSMVTGSQLYGIDEKTQKALKSFSNGKLKTEYVNNEEYLPRLTLGEKINMVLTRLEPVEQSHWYNRFTKSHVKADRVTRYTFWSVITDTYNSLRKPQWATGHPLLTSNPLLFTMTALWVREHNRVCDELVKKWPTWTDDKVYSIAKNIVLVQMMRIMLNDILDVEHLKYDPETFHDHLKSINNFNTPFELMLTTILPTGVPEELDYVKMHPILSNDNRQVLENGVSYIVRCMVNEKMGEVTANNDGAATELLTKFLLELSRENAVQSFNNYRRHLGLTAYGSFHELTGNWDTANALELLYGTVENVELLTGMLTEKKCDHAVPTFTVATNSFIINSIITNPLGSKLMWRPETFGGEFGFHLVKSANLKTFVCNNLVGKCDDDFIANIYAE